MALPSRLLVSSACLVALWAGCQQPPGSKPAAVAGHPSHQPTPSASAAPRGRDHRADYMKACLGAEELRSYCECGWGVFSSQTTAEQLHANRATQADLDRIQEVTVKRCGEKLPEPWVQSGFVRTCSRGQDSNQPYCGCVWTELRRRLGVGDLALGQPTDNPRFMIASRDSARACSSSLLPSSVQAAFVEGCTKGRSGADAFCSCAYRELTAVMSLGEVELATSTQSPDFIAAQQRVERICGKLKPRP